MAKRSATSELNHDNWNDQEEAEDAGKFTPLSGSELQHRVIRKAKRSINTSSGNNSLSGASPFAKFAGFTSASSSSPFSSFKASTNPSSTSPFSSFKASTDSPFSTLTKKVEEKANGSILENEEKSKDKTESEQKPISTVESSNTTGEGKQTRSLEYYRQLQSLNTSILKWMQLHLEKSSCCDFTPVFIDYKKHLDMLNVTYPVLRKEAADSKSVDTLKTPKEEPLKSSSNTSSGSSTLPKANTKQQQEDESNYGAHFSSNTTNTSTFSFGCKLTPTATSSISPSGPTSSSKQEEKKDNSEFSAGFFSNPFQPSSDKPFSFAVAPIQKSGSGEGEDQEYVPPKNDFVAVNEEDAFYTKRCKLFFKKGESYNEKGIGTLYLKSLEGKTQLLIRADTSLGNILLNIMLGASLPMSRTGKNNVLLVCIPNPPVDPKQPDSKEAIPLLIRVKSAEDADDLLEILNKHKS